MAKKVGLTIISEAELPGPSHDYLKAFDYVNVKLGAYSRGFGKTIDAMGADRHLWEYLVFNSVAKAEAEGKKWGQMCHRHQIKVFHANMEAGVSGTDPYPKYPNPYEAILTFVRAFRAHAPSFTKLWYNGWTWAATSDRRKLHDSSLMKQFDGWNPQIHGTAPSNILDTWDVKAFKYKKTVPELPSIPMIGVGRVDSEGKRWGFWAAYKKKILDTEIDGVDFYFGNGAKHRMLQTLPHFPALVECVDELRCDRRWNRAA
jgi:hypothetical protein